MATGPAAIAFPGQGGDWSAAVATLADQPDHPLVRALAERLGAGRWEELDGLDTRNAQPVIYVAGLVGTVATAERPGDGVALAMGHSLGEITAAAWAGAIDPLEGLDLMVARGRIGHDQQRERPGAMAAVNRWTRTEVEWLRRSVAGEGEGILDVAVTNSPTQIVLSGDDRLVDLAVQRANDAGAVARRLPIGGAYHSTAMVDAVGAFGALVARAVRADPQVPVLSSTLHRPLATAAELAEGLARSLVLPVDWPATVDAAVAFGVATALEAGPGDTLSRLARFAPALPIVRR